MIKFFKNEGTFGCMVWAVLAIAVVLLLLGVIEPTDYGSGGRR